MLRRRILASAMASVMALTSVAVVANAEEVKTDADLKALIDEANEFAKTVVPNVGSISSARFEDALDFAINVLEDEDSDNNDYTAAYTILKAVKDRTVPHTQAELQALLDGAKSKYERGNILNEELGDLRYDADKFAAFESAYETAELDVKSTDGRLISDDYDVLEAAINDLKELPQVTKSDFRKALEAYEKALQNEYKYESWRRGSVVDTTNSGAIASFEWVTTAYGELYYLVASAETSINSAYDELDKIQALNTTSQQDLVEAYETCKTLTLALNSFVPDSETRGTETSVQKLLDEYHGRLVLDYKSTDAEDLYDDLVAYAATVDIDGKGTQGTISVQQYINNYANQYVASADVATYASFNSDAPFYTVLNGGKYTSAAINVKADFAYYIGVDDEGYAVVDQTTGNYVFSDDKDTVLATDLDGAGTHPAKAVLVAKNTAKDLTALIKVEAADIVSGTDNHNWNNVADGDFIPWSVDDNVSVDWNWTAGAPGTNGANVNSEGTTVYSYTELDKAIQLAEDYINGDYGAAGNATELSDIDTTGSIKPGSEKGSTAEWTLVYRYLKYALTDKYGTGQAGTKTLTDVENLIEESYTLADETGDASLFNYSHMQLVNARQDANAWVKAAIKDKEYKDNFVGEVITNPNLIGNGVDALTSTDVWNALNGYYSALDADKTAFKYSFGEIYDKIAKVANDIDDGKLVASEKLTVALDEVAYRLSVVENLETYEGYELDNNAYTSDRFFQSFNRVFTWGDDYTLSVDSTTDVTVIYNASHMNLKNAYEALLDAVAAAAPAEEIKGDVDGSGKVNAADALAILTKIAAAEELPENADYNGDGSKNASDALAILVDVAAGNL